MTGSTKPVRTIKNWKLHQKGAAHIIHGRVFGDDRFVEGQWIFTSAIVMLDFRTKVAETQNTIYHLN